MPNRSFPISSVEVTVKNLDGHFAVLEIDQLHEEIHWPKNLLPSDITPGEKLSFDCRIKPESMLNKIIEKAKTKASLPEESKKLTSMRQLLETLIN